MGYFTSQVVQLAGAAGIEPTLFKFGVVLSAIFLFAITLLESGAKRA